MTWRGFAGSAREGDRLTPCLAGVALISAAADFDTGGFGFDTPGSGFGAVFGIGAAPRLGAALDTGFDFCATFGLDTGFCAALGLTTGVDVTFGFAAGFFAAAFAAGFAAGFFGAALDFAAAFFGAALGLAAGFFTAFGAAARVPFALDDFGAASAS